MTLGLAFWILWLIWVVFGILTHFVFVGVGGVYFASANAVLIAILLGLLAWAIFGPPLHR